MGHFFSACKRIPNKCALSQVDAGLSLVSDLVVEVLCGRSSDPEPVHRSLELSIHAPSKPSKASMTV